MNTFEKRQNSPGEESESVKMNEKEETKERSKSRR